MPAERRGGGVLPRLVIIGLLAVLAVVAGACGGAPGTVPSKSGVTAAPGTSASRGVKPTITRPLDATSYGTVDDVCGLVPQGAVQRLGYKGGKLPAWGASKYHAREHESVTCGLVYNPDHRTSGSVEIELYLELDVLGMAYRQPDTGTGAVYGFDGALTINGQPAVRQRVVNNPDAAYCELDLGLTDTSGIVLSMRGLDARRACAQLTRTAAAIVDNLAR